MYCMRKYFLIPAMMAFCAVLRADPAGELETVTKVSLGYGVRNSISLMGLQGCVKSWLGLPWTFAFPTPGARLTGITLPSWSLGLASAVIDFGTLDFRGPGNLLGKPFSAEIAVYGLEGKPFSLASPDDAAFYGIVLGKDRGVFILDEESGYPVFGLWETEVFLDSGFIGAVQKKRPDTGSEWFDFPQTEGLASWGLVHVNRVGEYAKFFMAGGHYTEFPGLSGVFIRVDTKLSYDKFYFTSKSCFSDGGYRPPAGSLISIYDISAALGLTGALDQGVELKIKESASTADTPAKKSLSLSSVAVSEYCSLNLDAALDYGNTEAEKVFSVNARISSDFVKGLVLGTYWEACSALSRQFDISLALGIKEKISLECGVLLRFYETSRALKVSCTVETKLGDCSIKLQGALAEPWIFYPEIKASKLDISLIVSTNSGF